MTTKLIIKSNGSIRVEGEFELFDDKGNAFDIAGRTAVSMCRCGFSNNKPFCDGAHKTNQFVAESNAFASVSNKAFLPADIDSFISFFASRFVIDATTNYLPFVFANIAAALTAD